MLPEASRAELPRSPRYDECSCVKYDTSSDPGATSQSIFRLFCADGKQMEISFSLNHYITWLTIFTLLHFGFLTLCPSLKHLVAIRAPRTRKPLFAKPCRVGFTPTKYSAPKWRTHLVLWQLYTNGEFKLVQIHVIPEKRIFSSFSFLRFQITNHHQYADFIF